MKTPAFWYRPHLTWQAVLLLPFALFYAVALYIRSISNRNKAPLPVPVIAVGNITAGGNGKTPTALTILSLINNISPHKKVFFLSRGTGAKLRGPTRVDPQGAAQDYGDEPLLLASHAPTIISRDRRAGAMLAVRAGAEIIIMDDGLQNKSITPDLRLILIDTARGFGNGLLLPAGPLRQSVRSATHNADAVILVGHGASPANLPVTLPALRGLRTPTTLPDLRQRYLAFAGLAYPDQFFQQLRDMGLTLVGTQPFPDHHAYSTQDIAELIHVAAMQNAMLITTDKDRVKLPATLTIATLPIQMQISPLTPLIDMLRIKCGIV